MLVVFDSVSVNDFLFFRSLDQFDQQPFWVIEKLQPCRRHSFPGGTTVRAPSPPTITVVEPVIDVPHYTDEAQVELRNFSSRR